MGNFWVRNTLAKTTLSCNLYGAAAADPGPNPAGQAPSLPTRGCGSGGTPSTGYNQTGLMVGRLLITLDDWDRFGYIPWTGTPRTRTRVRRQEAVRAGPGPGPAHTKCMGVMGVGIFWRIWSENGPVYLFWGDFRL